MPGPFGSPMLRLRTPERTPRPQALEASVFRKTACARVFARNNATDRPVVAGAECAARIDAGMNAPEVPPLRLTAFSHGGGCGCKIAPGVLAAHARAVGARRWCRRIAGRHRDVRRCGRVPAQRAPGDRRDDRLLHADRRRPARLRRDRRNQRDLRRVRDGRDADVRAGARRHAGRTGCRSRRSARSSPAAKSACRRANMPIAGGHTIDSVEPIYGLVAIGVVDPRHVKRNAGARAGDVLILGKPLGTGIYSAALKKDRARARSTTRRSWTARRASTRRASRSRATQRVHALTDVTGFGLLGHLLEMCAASSVGATIAFDAVPLHPGRGRARGRRLRDRRIGAQLDRVRRGRSSSSRALGACPCGADRPADLRRVARRVRAQAPPTTCSRAFAPKASTRPP